MKLILKIMIISLVTANSFSAELQDTLPSQNGKFDAIGQASVWSSYSFGDKIPLSSAVLYIPSINYQFDIDSTQKISIEGSLKLNGSMNSHPFDTIHTKGAIEPYRVWGKYSGNQFEIRAGLQKINFGSATLLRPLIWFDQVDPRDPLQLTSGVWGVLGRFYALSNSNLWAWCLYGNDKSRPWDIGTTDIKHPEFGGRWQNPIPNGEAAFSFHHRMADVPALGNDTLIFHDVNENRYAFDAKLDFGFGLWFEGVWINKSKKNGLLTNQEILNFGADNNFAIGNGLNIIFEQLIAANDENAFEFKKNLFFSALSASYPVFLNDNINAMFYYDWENKQFYNFFSWNHKFENLSLYLMAYLNPENYLLPQKGTSANTFSGKGLQLMLIYNY